MNTIASARIRSRLEIFSLTNILFFTFILSIPWAKLELVRRFAIAEPLVVGLVLLFFLQLSVGHKQISIERAPPSKYIFFLLLWAFAILLSGLSVTYSSQYIFEAAGMIYLIVLALFVTLLAAECEFQLKETFRWVRISLLVVIGIGTLGILYQVITNSYDLFFYSNARKLISSFKMPNQLGGFLILFFPLLWEEVQRRGPAVRRFFYGLALLALFGCVVATGSRSAVAALVIGIGLYGLFYLIRMNVKMLFAGGLLIGVGFALIQLLKDQIWVVGRALSVLSIETIQNRLTDSWRLENWSLGVDLFNQNPINGYGLGNVQIDFEHEIHNLYISIMAEMGIVGVIAFVLIMGYVGVIALRNIKISAALDSIYWSAISRGMFIGLVTFLIYSTQHMMLRSRFLWLAIGLIVALYVVLKVKLKEELLLKRQSQSAFERGGA